MFSDQLLQRHGPDGGWGEEEVQGREEEGMEEQEGEVVKREEERSVLLISYLFIYVFFCSRP